LLSPFRMVCGNFILPEPANYVFSYPFFFLRNLLYIIEKPPAWRVAVYFGLKCPDFIFYGSM